MAIKLFELPYIACASRRCVVRVCWRHLRCHPRLYTWPSVIRHIYRLTTGKNHIPFSSVRRRFQVHSWRHYALQGHYSEWDQHSCWLGRWKRHTVIYREELCFTLWPNTALQLLSYQIHYNQCYRYHYWSWHRTLLRWLLFWIL